MSIQVVGVNPSGDAPDVHGAESREDGPSFAGLFEQVKKSKPPALDDRKVERREDDSREAQAARSSDAADGAAAASGSEDVVAPVQQQERRAQEASPGRGASDSREEGETAVDRSTPQSAKEGVPVAPRQSLLEANQELNLMLKFNAAASTSFEMQLKQTAAGQQDMAMLVPRKEVPLPVKEATVPRGEMDREKPESAPVMAKGAADSRDTVRSETGRPAEGAASGQPEGARPQSADLRADRGSSTGNPDAETSTPQKSRGGESTPTQSPSQRASMNAAVAEVRVDETVTDAASEMAKPVTGDPLAKAGTIGPKLASPLASAAPQKMAAPEVDLANQIVQSAKLLLKNGQESIEIRLKPDILGKLFMRIDVVDRVMTAQMTVQSEQVKTMIESQLQTLQTALESSGLRLNRVAISVEDSQRADSQKSDSWNHEQASPDGQDDSRNDNKDEEPNERSKRPPRNPRQVHIRV